MKRRSYSGWVAPIIVLLTFCTVILFATKRNSFSPKPAAPLSSPAETSPSFLDQAIPAASEPPVSGVKPYQSTGFNSFEERIKSIQSVSPRPVIFPEGFAEFIQAEDAKSDWNKGTVLFLTERNGMEPEHTVRDFLGSSLAGLSLHWKYDSARDVITTDFNWRRDDPRSAHELINYLIQHRPGRYDELIRTSLTSGWGTQVKSSRVTDPWLTAFDALLSKPENFSKVWRLRFIDDSRRYFSSYLIDNLMAKKMRDDRGVEHIVFINDQPEPMYPGEGSVCYYVFNENGLFEQGGLMDSGHRCGDTQAFTNWGGTELTLRTFFNGTSEVDTSFILTDHGLVPQKQDHWSAGLGIGKMLYVINP